MLLVQDQSLDLLTCNSGQYHHAAVTPNYGAKDREEKDRERESKRAEKERAHLITYRVNYNLATALWKWPINCKVNRSKQ